MGKPPLQTFSILNENWFDRKLHMQYIPPIHDIEQQMFCPQNVYFVFLWNLLLCRVKIITLCHLGYKLVCCTVLSVEHND